MQLTGHRDVKSYKKYSKQRFENASACAMQNVMSSGGGTEAPMSYEDAMRIERNRLDAIKVSLVVCTFENSIFPTFWLQY